MKFLDDDILLSTKTAKKLYKEVKDLPIIDYHCHLDEKQIVEDRKFSDIGQLWLEGDHYKWRAMRLCGVDEHYITGSATYHDKFIAYASIMPSLIGNPLYYWSHLELKSLFGITTPLSKDTAEAIWQTANEKIKTLSARSLLKKFKVQFVATTDDPFSPLSFHGECDGVKISPTFRPDKALAENADKKELERRFDFFVEKGCRIADFGFDFFEGKREDLLWLFEACKKRNVLLQLHFGTFRNVNTVAFENIGKDSGYDIFRSAINLDEFVSILDEANGKGILPSLVLYPLNDEYLRTVATLSGAFKNVYVGSAWWFNDTKEGIRRNLETVSEYAVLGTSLGMLTDSRSLSSYVRFDFYRRILCSFVGEKVEKGEYDENSATTLCKNLCYYNIKGVLSL